MVLTTRLMPLGEVIRFGNGKIIKPGGVGLYPVFGSNGVIGGSDKYIHENGIIIGRVGAYCGAVVYCPGKFWASDNTLVAFPANTECDTRFLSYLLQDANLSRYAGGAAQPLVTQTVLKQVEVRIPPFPIQRRIASILSAYDDLIENNQKRIAILEEMARRLYREWFVHFRYPGHESVPLVDSPLGRIPQGWEVRRFGDVITLNYGKALKAEERVPGSVPVFGSSGIVGYHAEHMEPGPGLIVGRKGNVGSLHWSDGPFFPIDTVYFTSSAVFPLRYLLHSMATMNFLNNDAAVPGLSRQQAYGLDVIVPPQDVLGVFCKYAEDYGQMSSNLTRQNDVLRRTRDLLLPRLMSGQLSVTAAEAAAP